MPRADKDTTTGRYPFVFYLFIAATIMGVWALFLAPEFKKVPDNFNYSVNLFTLSNTFDSKTGKYSGEHLAQSQLNYAASTRDMYHLIIKNSFIVNKSGNKLNHGEGLYYIDPYSGKHLTDQNGNFREGYLFAPRYASKKSFIFWYPNYDVPIQMDYQGEGLINNVKVYHYQSKLDVDQTENFKSAPNLEKNKVKTSIDLQIWVEPISGYLIKAVDRSQSVIVDSATGRNLRPIQKVSHQFTQNSINDKTAEAVKLKWRILIVDFLIPFLILFVTLILIFKKTISNYLRNWHKKVTERHLFIKLFLIFSILLIIVASTFIIFIPKPVAPIKIGIAQWTNNPEFVSALQGFKDGLAENGYYEGLNVQFFSKNPQGDIEKQVEIIQTFLANKIDLIFSLGTCGTLIAKGITNKVPIVFAAVLYPVTAGIVPSDSDIKSNVVGVSNYISPAEQFYRFELLFPNTKQLGFVYKKGSVSSAVQLKDFTDLLSKRNIAVVPVPADDAEDMKKQIVEKFHQKKINALFFACDTLIRTQGHSVAAALTRELKIPSFSCDRRSVIEGVLMGYHSDLYLIGRLAGFKAALVLQGAESSWLSTAYPPEGLLIINMSTARLLGITVPINELDTNRALIEN